MLLPPTSTYTWHRIGGRRLTRPKANIFGGRHNVRAGRPGPARPSVDGGEVIILWIVRWYHRYLQWWEDEEVSSIQFVVPASALLLHSIGEIQWMSISNGKEWVGSWVHVSGRLVVCCIIVYFIGSTSSSHPLWPNGFFWRHCCCLHHLQPRCKFCCKMWVRYVI